MKKNSVQYMLFFTVLTMMLLPMAAAFYFLDHSLQTSLDLGFNQQIHQTLDRAAQNLKRLKNVDSENSEKYREDFEQVANLKMIYSQPELVKNNIMDSLKIYFGIGLTVAVLFSLAIATFLSQKISKLYRNTFSDLIRQQEKVRYLEEISTWQELAKMLAHEIKNPLTPIEILVTALTKSFQKKTENEFKMQLLETEIMISEELGHLKNIVHRFSEFSKIPKVQAERHNITEVVRQNIKIVSALFLDAKIEFELTEKLEHFVKIDTTLFRQVITNIVKNAVEANPNQKIVIKFKLFDLESVVQLKIHNDGTPIPIGLIGRIFDPYFSEKKGKDNMGLGLTIVRKIIIEHEGEIEYALDQGLPGFVITLRKVN